MHSTFLPTINVEEAKNFIAAFALAVMVLSFHAADTGNVPATDASMTACSPAKTSRDRTKARILDLEKKLETSPMMAPSRMTAHIVVKRGKGGAASDTVVATLEQLRETFTAIGARASQ